MVSMTQTNDTRAYVLQPNQGDVLENLHVRFLATSASSADTCMVLDITNPGPGGPPLHIHHEHDEWYFVVQGRYRFRMGEQEQEGGPGTFAYVPRGVVHSFASVGAERGRVLSASFPGGLDHFVKRLSDLQRREAGEAEFAALHREFQSEVVGPPLVK